MTDVDLLIIGAGPSGIGMGVQLIREAKTRNFEIIEKSSDVGGTWLLNTYPGCGCDVASHFYSYSFEMNPNWSQKYALQPEIHAYFKGVALKYGISQQVRFQSEVLSARWIEADGHWEVLIRDLTTRQVRKRTAKILISACGALSEPNGCNFPGKETYQGRLFHSARWDPSFDWKDQQVIVIGNGCSATQIVPAMSEGQKAVSKITQFARQPHWVARRDNPRYSPIFKFCMQWVPLTLKLYRAWLYWDIESRFKVFQTEKGKSLRNRWANDTAAYIRETAPEKYRDFLVPKIEYGCKRRVNDSDYLASLHRENVDLVYQDSIESLTPQGVRTKNGNDMKADAIILANGFKTELPLHPMEINGRNGVSINDHWQQVSEGSPASYFGTCLSNFPNFFIMMGPNSLSGHLSVVFTSECQINFILRVIKPILKKLAAERSRFPSLMPLRSDVVEVTSAAEQRDMDNVQRKAKSLVWATGCSSWFLDPKTGRNTIMFPDWQYKFWLRSVFIRWNDFKYSQSRTEAMRKPRGTWDLGSLKVTIALIALSAALLLALKEIR